MITSKLRATPHECRTAIRASATPMSAKALAEVIGASAKGVSVCLRPLVRKGEIVATYRGSIAYYSLPEATNP